MKTIRVTADKHGVTLEGFGRVRYVPRTLLGTAVETMALRELAASLTLVAPGDWQ